MDDICYKERKNHKEICILCVLCGYMNVFLIVDSSGNWRLDIED